MKIDLIGYIGLFVASLIIATTSTPLFRSLAVKRKILDTPNLERKIQRTAVPYLGGFGIALAVVSTTLIAITISDASTENYLLALSVLAPAMALGLIGFIDDKKHLTPLSRFIAQTFAGIFTALVLILTNTVGNPTNYLALDVLLTIIWVVGICNAINFFDNMDGAAGGISALAGFGFAIIGLQNGQYFVAAFGLVLSGACVGYLFWNWNPAKIYMGDAGALFIGVILAALAVRVDPVSVSGIGAFFVPICVLALPILDTTTVVIDRLRRRVSPFEGGLDHLSHRLRRKGLSVRQSVTTLCLIQSISILIGFLINMSGNTYDSILATLEIILGLSLLIWFLRIPARD
jgi:UDP-GlcNAc:undecaprenyl-phosphate/decaprenyl-phosphate GlcNAc-1-phosphate transferase